MLDTRTTAGAAVLHQAATVAEPKPFCRPAAVAASQNPAGAGTEQQQAAGSKSIVSGVDYSTIAPSRISGIWGNLGVVTTQELQTVRCCKTVCAQLGAAQNCVCHAARATLPSA
jgi:hypothetical protein